MDHYLRSVGALAASTRFSALVTRFGGESQGIRVGDGVHALGRFTGGDLLGIGLADLHHSGGIGMGDQAVQLEHGGLVLLIGAMQDAECPVDREHQEIADLGDEGAAAAAVQEIKDDIKGIGDKLFIKGALHAIAEAVLLARGITFRQFLDGEGEAVTVRGTTQDVIAGDPVEIGGAYQKIKTAFPDAVFVLGKQSLGDPKLLCGTLLADALFFS